MTAPVNARLVGVRNGAGDPPPHDLDAEAAVLSAVMLDPAPLAEVREIVQPRDFYSTPNARIFEAISSLADDGRAVDVVTVANQLKEGGFLGAVGGTPYLMQLTDATPAVANVLTHAELVRRASVSRTLSHAMAAEAAKLRSGADPHEVLASIREMSERLTHGGTPSESPFDGRWLRLADTPDLLATEPSKQRWLLTRFQDGRDHGVFPRGRCGLLAGTGGVSKTYCAMQLGVAVAAGGFWLDTFKAPEPGHVLLAVAEEDRGEVHRRLWRICNALELSRDQRRAVAERLDVLPLHGLPVSLLATRAPGIHVASDIAAELHRRLVDRGVEWALIVIDPLSRWAGGGTEADNEAATRFVQIVETLTEAPGNPAVMLSHHSSKTSSSIGASDARGVSGIRDGFRWMAQLDAIRTEDGQRAVRLRNGKSNYSLEFDDLLLVRNTEPGTEGTLRPASRNEAEAVAAALPPERQSQAQRAQAKKDQKREVFQARRSLVLDVLPLAPEHMSRDQLHAALQARGEGWSYDTIRSVIAGLMDDELVVDLSDGSRAKPRQWARPTTPSVTS